MFLIPIYQAPSGTVTESQVTGLTSDLAAKATKVSGTPTGHVALLTSTGDLSDGGTLDSTSITPAHLIVRTLASTADTGLAGEVAFLDGVFYGYDGTTWNVLNNSFSLMGV